MAVYLAGRAVLLACRRWQAVGAIAGRWLAVFADPRICAGRGRVRPIAAAELGRERGLDRFGIRGGELVLQGQDPPGLGGQGQRP
jgi:hypothetical protein